MLYLLSAIFFGTLIGHIFKLRDRLGSSTFPILFVNYIVALLISAVQVRDLDFGPHPLGSISLAILLGVLFVLCYLLMNKAIRQLGVSIAVSLTRLSAVLPTLASILLFSEHVEMLQIPGLILAFLSLPFSAQELPRRSNIRRLFHEGLGLGLILFVAMGVNDFVFKVKGEFFLDVDHSTFLLVVYFVSLLLTASQVYHRRLPIKKHSIALGIGLGVVNYGAAVSIMAAMEVLPGMIAYPLNGVGVIFLTTVTGLFIWKERLKPHNYIFIAAASIAILLINL